jgi:hypothetical protein
MVLTLLLHARARRGNDRGLRRIVRGDGHADRTTGGDLFGDVVRRLHDLSR